MSFGGGHTGGRTRFSTKVFLNLYDLSPANDFLYAIGMGLHHSGVEISGSEYSFASGAGIFETPPKFAPGVRFREQIEMGSFDGGQQQLQQVLYELRQDSQFGPNDYHLIHRNCNHFANALCWKLLGKTIPGYVNRLAEVGSCCSCLLPRHLLEHAPVGDPAPPPSSSSAAPTNSFIVRSPRSRDHHRSAATVTPMFSGAGDRLGSIDGTKKQTDNAANGSLWKSSSSVISSSSNNNNNTQSVDDLTDRRERARKAAMARLQRNQQQEAKDN